MASVRCAFIFNVSHSSVTREGREDYARLLSSFTFRILSYFHFGDEATRVSWAWRLCDWSRPARRFGKEMSVFQAFNLEDFGTLEERLKDEMVQHFHNHTNVGHVGTVKDVSLAIAHLTGSLPWDLPELISPKKALQGAKQRSEIECDVAETKNYIFVVQPCPQTDLEWNQFCGGSRDVLESSLFPDALYTQLRSLKHIGVYWLNTALAQPSQEESITKELSSCLNETLTSCGGRLIPCSFLLSTNSQRRSCFSVPDLPVSTYLSYYLSNNSSSKVKSVQKKMSFLCSTTGEPICILEVCAASVSSLRVMTHRPRTRQSLLKQNVNKDCGDDLVESFPSQLLVEGTVAKTRLGALVDAIDRTCSYMCVGWKHNVKSFLTDKTEAVGCDSTGNGNSLSSESHFSLLLERSLDVATISDGLMRSCLTPSKQFESVLMFLRNQNVVLVLHDQANRSTKYVLDPMTSTLASLHLLKRSCATECVHDTLTLFEESGIEENGMLSEHGGLVFDCIESWYRLLPHYGVNQSTVSSLKRLIGTGDSSIATCDVVTDLKTAYRQELKRQADKSQKSVDGVASGYVSDHLADESVLTVTCSSVFEELRRDLEEILSTTDGNFTLDQALSAAVSAACEKLKHLCDKPKVELSEFISRELLLTTDQLKAKYQRVPADKDSRPKEHQFQVLLRFEVALLDQANTQRGLFTECVSILRMLAFLTNAETLRQFLDETILQRYGVAVREGVQSVYEDLIPRPSQMATDGEDDSDSDEERRERLLSLRSYKLLNAPSGPKIPSVERKFARHGSFHDCGKQREISIPLPTRKKQHREESVEMERTESQLVGDKGTRTRSQTLELLGVRKGSARRAVRRTLFSSLTNEENERRRSPRHVLKRTLTFAGRSSVSVSKDVRVNIRSLKKGKVMVEETPLKVKEPTFSWNQECGSGVTDDHLSPKTIQDTPKRNFYSRSFSVGHLSRNCRSSSAKTFRNPFCERSLKSDHRSGECGSNKNALQSGRVGSSCNAIAGENQSETADIMCKQEALLLGPLVGQSVSQSLGGSDDLKSPSQLQLSRLLHSQMQCSSSLVKAARDNYPSI